MSMQVIKSTKLIHIPIAYTHSTDAGAATAKIWPLWMLSSELTLARLGAAGPKPAVAASTAIWLPCLAGAAAGLPGCPALGGNLVAPVPAELRRSSAAARRCRRNSVPGLGPSCKVCKWEGGCFFG